MERVELGAGNVILWIFVEKISSDTNLILSQSAANPIRSGTVNAKPYRAAALLLRFGKDSSTVKRSGC